MQVLLKFWLGVPLDSPTDLCPFCSFALDAMGHHSLTCKHGGFVIARHNRLRDCLAHFCQITGLAPKVEKGCNFGCKDCMCLADVLVPNWSLSRLAAFDLKVINPLNADSILEASMIPGSTAEKGERDKHLKNDGPCNERGWSCIPLPSCSGSVWWMGLSRPNLSYPKIVLGPKRAARFHPTDQSRLA